MSQSLLAGPARTRMDAQDETTHSDAETVQALLGALGDGDGRDILAATSDEALTASELAETCDLPLSTTYRKLDLLTDAGLLRERLRLRHSGKHSTEYVRSVDDVRVSLDPDGGVEATVFHRESAGSRGHEFVAPAGQ